MRLVLLFILVLALGESYGQIDEDFNSFDGAGEWVSPGGNTGSHVGDLCFNITGNYLAGEFYVFQSPMYDFSTWSNVELLWNQESDVRNGDVLGLYFYDNGWSFYDISNLNGFYGVTLPTTTIALAFVLNTTGGSGNLNGKYSHISFLSIYDPQPLPVELLDFAVTLKEDGNLINWETASEYQSDYFEVYKSSNGTDWLNLTTTKAAGFSTYLQEYEYFDRDLSEGYIYYRLEQTDIDGTTETFDPVYIYRNSKPVLKKYNILGQEVKQ